VVESSAALNSKVAALEDEMRIVKGEVKQVLTEIRSAILVQDNPFEEATSARPRAVQIVPAVAEEPARVEIVMPRHEELTARHPAAPEPAVAAVEAAAPQPSQAAVAGGQAGSPSSSTHIASTPAPPRAAPRWSLLTVASLAAWAEEAFRRVGPQRLAILLDLCETAGYLTADARQALSRVGDLDLPQPEQPPSPMEVTVLLRQLDALLQGEAHGQGLQAAF
jgi:hypothetical protein